MGVGVALAVMSGVAVAGGISTASVAAKQNKDIAKQNFQAQQEANETNLEINRTNIENQWKMYEDQKEYNKPINQRARLEEAGLNPYLMLENGDAGIAQSVTQPTSLPAQGPQMPNYSQGLKGVSDSLMQIPQLVTGISGAMNAVDKLPFEIAQLQTDAFLKLVESGKSAAEAKQIVQEMDWFNETKSIMKEGMTLNNAVLGQSVKQTAQTIANLELQGQLLQLDVNFRKNTDYFRAVQSMNDAVHSKLKNILMSKEIDWFDEKVQAEIRIKLVDAVYKSNLATKESGWTKEKAEKYVDSLISVADEYVEVVENKKELGDVEVEVAKETKKDRIAISNDQRRISSHNLYHSYDAYNLAKQNEKQRHENYVERLDTDDLLMNFEPINVYSQSMLNLYNFTSR